ncbi:M23 family metallopeptidase [Fulvimarina sp. MAC8]|uniref:M23 family metallopeptidase n=1 Tax=Fulvimarina sp. MAC8 TaxID=3162874 RepID=UPI0032ED497E
MDASPRQRAGFGRRKQPITFVMARGEEVRHVTLDHRHLLRGSVISGLAAMLLGGMAYYGLQDSAHSSVPTESALRQSYESRLANLRTKLDEATSRQFVAQKMVESKVDVLLSQQEMIAERYERLEPIFERARENGILPDFANYSTPVPTPRPSFEEGEFASDTSDISGIRRASAEATDPANMPLNLRGDSDGATDEPDLLDPFKTASLRQSTSDHSQDALSGFGRAIDYAEIQQIANMKVLTSEAIERSTQIASVLSSVGIEPEEHIDLALGGPYEPVPENAGFDTHYAELENALDRLEGLRGVSERLPFAAPMAKNLMSSRFGIRSDPFLKRRALHAGIDYAARSGTPIRATAAGTVVRAGRAGGYGNLVEIDHGNGIKTRFGHMSRIDVKVGDQIEPGTQLGAVGSTGRSTGPHLHYEVRRNGQAIDPMRFIRAGRQIEDLS